MNVISPTATVAAESSPPQRWSRLARLVDPPRITGLDIARALAVLGMLGAHVAAIPEFEVTDPVSYLSIVHGNSAILFALLAGISIALMTGRTRIPDPSALPRLRLMLLGRAAMMFLIGLLLELTGTLIAVILPFFAVLFLTATPFLRWKPRRLLLTALAMAVLAPPLVQLAMQSALLPGGYAITFLISGVYQLTTWLPLMLAGMAIGRLDLTSQRNAARIIGIGVGLAIGASVLALTLPGILSPAVSALGMDVSELPVPQVGLIAGGTPTDMSSASGASLEPLPADGGSAPEADGMGHGSSSFGSIGSDSGPSAMVGAGWPSYPEQLQASTPFTHVINAFLHSGAHSGGSLATLGSGGLAATVVGLCLLVTGPLRTVQRLLAPLAALGSMPLTAYSAHVVLILVIAGPGGGLHAMAAWLWMGLGLILACTVWALYRGRGPLETITARSARAMAAGTENITTAG